MSRVAGFRGIRCAALSLVLCGTSFTVAAAATAPAPPSSAPADSAFAHQDWERAATGYQALVKAVPGSGRYWYRLGFARQSLGRFAEAAAAFRRADALGTPPQYGLYNLACALSR